MLSNKPKVVTGINKLKTLTKTLVSAQFGIKSRNLMAMNWQKNFKYPSLKPNTIMTDKEIANTFAITFQTLGSNANVPMESLNLRHQIVSQNSVFSLSNNDDPHIDNLVHPFSIDELSLTLDKFKGKTSSGPDTLAYPLLINLSKINC